MTFQAATKILSASTRTCISSLADEYGARELWLFGSAAASTYPKTEPTDIDIAFLEVPGPAKDALAAVLDKTFPGCRVDDALGYTVGGGASQPSLPKLHFVLADGSREFQEHPISCSIRRGICLWRAN